MRAVFAEGFPPVWDENARVLILGSFPSVKSREEGFYYGNRQNRFWRTVADFFEESAPNTVEDKRAFLLRRGIALWDVVTRCRIVGSKDVTISEEEIADIPALLAKSNVAAILCNGSKAYELLVENFPKLHEIAQRLPSTSPANPRFEKAAWHTALGRFCKKS